MIIRVVKLSFHTYNTGLFESLFDQNKDKIIAQKGCHKVQLLKDINKKGVFFTYSYWDTEADLNAYRQSDLFKGIWEQLKVLFNHKPEAWSTININETI